MPRLLCVLLLAVGLAGALASAQRTEFVPVTDATLQNPDPDDWVNWRRTLDGWGYSPLNQINTQNASRLALVWSRGVTPGVGETTPLVYKGTMYLTKPMSEDGVGGVLALDAATGDLRWEYRKSLEAKPAFDGRMRSLAIFKARIYLNTPDAHIVALDAETGL